MIAARLDTLPGKVNMANDYLSSPDGRELQQRAYGDIMKAQSDGGAWDRVLQEEKNHYMVAFVKVMSLPRQVVPAPRVRIDTIPQEALRYWPTFNMSFPRQSVKDIQYQGATIPAGTPFFMVRT